MQQTDPEAGRWIYRGLLLLVAVAALPWGGNVPGAMAAGGLWLALLSLLSLRSRRLASKTIATWPMVCGVVWIGWIALQALPLPEQLLARINGQAWAIHAATPGTHWWSISWAPGATLSGLFLSLGYAQAYWLAASCIRSSARIKTLLWVVTAAAAAQAIYGAVMTLSGVEWGVLEPKTFSRGVATGTFVNRNHLAGYLGLGLAAGIGLMLSETTAFSTRTWRSRLIGWIALLLSTKILIRALLATMVIALVLTRSRMGNIAFNAALLLSGMAWLLLRHNENRRAALLFLLSLVLVDVLILSRYFGLDALVERVQQTELRQENRALVFADLEPAIRAHALLGSGLGTFQHVFTGVQSVQVRGRYEHAHNDYAEFLIESGLVGSLALALFTAWHLIQALRQLAPERRPMHAGLGFTVFFALVALGVHATVDFNLHIPATVLTLMILLGSLAGCQARSRKRSPRNQI